VGPLLCKLWERIESETAESEARAETLVKVKTMFACNL
jgi:hypothetical protein